MKKISKKWLVIGGIIVLLLLLRNGGNATMALHQILYRAIVLIPLTLLALPVIHFSKKKKEQEAAEQKAKEEAQAKARAAAAASKPKPQAASKPNRPAPKAPVQDSPLPVGCVIVDDEPQGNPYDGYWITTPYGEEHLYPVPNPDFSRRDKACYKITGCDQYGNRLHPNDPSMQEEARRKREEEERIFMEMENERMLEEAEAMAECYGGRPEDYMT